MTRSLLFIVLTAAALSASVAGCAASPRADAALELMTESVWPSLRLAHAADLAQCRDEACIDELERVWAPLWDVPRDEIESDTAAARERLRR